MKISSIVKFFCILAIGFIAGRATQPADNLAGGNINPDAPRGASDELRAFGESFGVRNVDSEMGIISEIRIKLGDNMRFTGEPLTSTEMEDLNDYIADAPELLKKIEKYNSFIKRVNGKKIFVMPE